MTAHSIPDDVSEFILQYIDSIAQLEALLLLLHNEHGFSLEECASRLYISASDCDATLQPLIDAQFIAAKNGRFIFQVGAKDGADRIKALDEVYRRQLIPITNLIHSKQQRVQKFADAFRVKREP